MSINKIPGVVLGILIAMAILLLVVSKAISRKKAILGEHSGLMYTCQANAGIVQVQMLPSAQFFNSKDKMQDVYVLRIKLKLRQSSQNNKLMQYMNYGMGKSFFALEAGDTLPQIACEKIPGLDRNEFVYMSCFKKPVTAGGNLFIGIADAIAGFRTTPFEFKTNALQKLDR